MSAFGRGGLTDLYGDGVRKLVGPQRSRGAVGGMQMRRPSSPGAAMQQYSTPPGAARAGDTNWAGGSPTFNERAPYERPAPATGGVNWGGGTPSFNERAPYEQPADMNYRGGSKNFDYRTGQYVPVPKAQQAGAIQAMKVVG